MERRAAARRQQVDLRHLRPRRRHRRGALVLPDRARTTCTTTTASTRTCCSTSTIRGQRRKVLVHPDRNGYVYVLDRATGEVLSADAVRLHQHRRAGSTSRPAGSIASRGEEDRRRQDASATSARRRPGPRTGSRPPSRRAPGCSTSRTTTSAWTSRGWRRTTSPARRIVGANVRMYAGPGGNRGDFTAWDPVAGKPRWADQGILPGLERRPGDRRRRRLLRHDGGLVQGGRRATGQRALEVQDRLRDHRPAGHLQAGRTASSTSPSSPASAAGPAPWWPAELDPRDAHRRARLRRRDERPAEILPPRGACCMCLRCRRGAARPCARSLSCRRAALRRGPRPPRRPRACCGSAPIRTTFPIRTDGGRGSRTGWPRWSPRDLHATVRYTWWPQHRGFIRNTLKAGDLRRGDGRCRAASSWRRRPAPITARPTSSSTARTAGSPCARSTIRPCAGCGSACR